MFHVEIDSGICFLVRADSYDEAMATAERVSGGRVNTIHDAEEWVFATIYPDQWAWAVAHGSAML